MTSSKGRELFFKGEIYLAEKSLKREKDYKCLAYLYEKQKLYSKALKIYENKIELTLRELIRANGCLKKIGDFESSMYLENIIEVVRTKNEKNSYLYHSKFGYGVILKEKDDIKECFFPILQKRITLILK
ncbi:hypothetical protein [Cetobacterium sp.]|uniref:hypothetical protein n=1 Tax=Cetobacterium sp. TaxID=2071632 RepID=UPI003F34E56A